MYRNSTDFFFRNIEKGLRIDASKYELAKARKLQDELDKIKDNFVLRRTKDSTIREQMPKKTDQVVFCQVRKILFCFESGTMFLFLSRHPFNWMSCDACAPLLT